MESNHMNSIHTSRTKEKPKPQLNKKQNKKIQPLHKEQQKRLLSEPPKIEENQNKLSSNPVTYTFTKYSFCCVD